MAFLALCVLSILFALTGAHTIPSHITKRQDNSCSASTTTLSNAADASSLASACSIFTGTVALATGVTEDIAFDGLQRIEGSLSVVNVPQLTSLSSSTLETITDAFTLNTLTVLTTVSLSQLHSVNTIDFAAIPGLQELSILQTLETVSNISIQNTQIAALEGFSLATIENFVIANNPYMNTINLQPYNITGVLAIQANGRHLDVSMPNIQFAQNMTFRNCSSISIPSITQINGSLGIFGNSISSFNGAPLLQEVNGGLSFVSNPEMANIALPELQSVAGGFQVVNNTNLTELDQLYNLRSIVGAVDLEGPFTNITFPNIEDVRGAFQVNSTADMSCDSFDSLYSGSVIKGMYICQSLNDQANKTRSSTPTTTSTPSGTGTATMPSASSSSGLTHRQKVSLGVGLGFGLLAMLCSLYVAVTLSRKTWAEYKRRQAAQKAAELPPEADGAEIDRAAMMGNETEKFELEQPLEEMPAGKSAVAQELPAEHGETELDRSASTKAPEGVESRHEMPANEPASLDKTEVVRDDGR